MPHLAWTTLDGQSASLKRNTCLYSTIKHTIHWAASLVYQLEYLAYALKFLWAFSPNDPREMNSTPERSAQSKGTLRNGAIRKGNLRNTLLVAVQLHQKTLNVGKAVRGRLSLPLIKHQASVDWQIIRRCAIANHDCRVLASRINASLQPLYLALQLQNITLPNTTCFCRFSFGPSG